jgi:hypothetical protein
MSKSIRKGLQDLDDEIQNTKTSAKNVKPPAELYFEKFPERKSGGKVYGQNQQRTQTAKVNR